MLNVGLETMAVAMVLDVALEMLTAPSMPDGEWVMQVGPLTLNFALKIMVASSA